MKHKRSDPGRAIIPTCERTENCHWRRNLGQARRKCTHFFFPLLSITGANQQSFPLFGPKPLRPNGRSSPPHSRELPIRRDLENSADGHPTAISTAPPTCSHCRNSGSGSAEVKRNRDGLRREDIALISTLDAHIALDKLREVVSHRPMACPLPRTWQLNLR
jgi:hypothetical protein